MHITPDATAKVSLIEWKVIGWKNEWIILGFLFFYFPKSSHFRCCFVSPWCLVVILCRFLPPLCSCTLWLSAPTQKSLNLPSLASPQCLFVCVFHLTCKSLFFPPLFLISFAFCLLSLQLLVFHPEIVRCTEPVLSSLERCAAWNPGQRKW